MFRKTCGKFEEAPVEADLVIGVPDSLFQLLWKKHLIPYEMGLIKNKYVGRTFIQSGN